MENKYLKEFVENGHIFEKERMVTKEILASALGSGRADVLSTPMLIAFMEATCNEGMQPFLQEGYITVGTVVNIKHLKATPLGSKIFCKATLLGIDRAFLKFQVDVYDEKELVGTGEHERAFVHQKRFEEKTNEKLKK